MRRRHAHDVERISVAARVVDDEPAVGDREQRRDATVAPVEEQPVPLSTDADGTELVAERTGERRRVGHPAAVGRLGDVRKGRVSRLGGEAREREASQWEPVSERRVHQHRRAEPGLGVNEQVRGEPDHPARVTEQPRSALLRQPLEPVPEHLAGAPDPRPPGAS
jgi:hypothetical protein